MISDLDAVIIMAPVLAGGLAAGWGLRGLLHDPGQAERDAYDDGYADAMDRRDAIAAARQRDAYDDGYADAMDRRDAIAAARQPPPPTPAEREYQETWGNLARLRADTDTWFADTFGEEK